LIHVLFIYFKFQVNSHMNEANYFQRHRAYIFGKFNANAFWNYPKKTLIHVHCFRYFVHFLFLKGMNFNWYKTLSEDNTWRSRRTTFISTNTMHIVSYSRSKTQHSHIKTRLSSYTSFSHHDPLRHWYFCAVLRVFTLKRRLRRQWGGIFSSK